MNPEQMASEATTALEMGLNITLVRHAGKKMPKGFPHGELVCQNFDGEYVFSYSPQKVLAWLRDSIDQQRREAA